MSVGAAPATFSFAVGDLTSSEADRYTATFNVPEKTQ